MRIGFSTGAIARGDYRRALEVLRGLAVEVVELSALRIQELAPLVNDLDRLDLTQFSAVSFHAPSMFGAAEEAYVATLLRSVAQRGIPVVIHPDSLWNFDVWREFGGSLLVENMDKRKPIGRSAAELAEIFARLPEAGFCFDIGHARQVDPSMLEAYKLLTEHGSRLRQVHMSELNTASHHEPMSLYAIHAFRRVAGLIPADVPVVLETLIDQGQSDVMTEIEKAEAALTIQRPLAAAS